MSVNFNPTEQYYNNKTALAEHNPAPKKTNNSNNIKKAIIIGSACALAIGTAAILIKNRANLKKAKEFFTRHIKTEIGNNNFLDDAIKASDDYAENFAKEHPKEYTNIIEYIKNNVLKCPNEEILEEGYLYHGTSIETSKNILEKGITPFASKGSSNKAPGLGRGVYTAPKMELAKMYSDDGVILPYKFEGSIGRINCSLDDFRANISNEIYSAIAPNTTNSSLFSSLDDDAFQIATENFAQIANKAAREAGFDALYSNEGMTKGLLSGVFGNLPEGIDTMGQVAVLDGRKLTLDVSKLKEINPIDKHNAYRFMN